jgi:glycosyltransferase involved in cell wall biosynthesis
MFKSHVPSPATPSLATNPPPRRKVLVIAHNHPSFFPGGGELLAYQLFKQLQQSPDYQAVFLGATGSMNREEHLGTPFLALEGKEDEFLFFGDRFDYFLQSQRDLQSLYRDFAQFLIEQKPDIVHFHHTIRLGVEMLRMVRDVLPKARIIYTLHDFIPLCFRDGQMIRTKTDELCSKATPSRCHECYPDIPAAHFGMREHFIKSHLALVDVFTSPSYFLAERFVEWGIPAEKMQIVQNGTLATGKAAPRHADTNRPVCFGFFGQISHFKGTLLLVEAAKILLERGITQFNVEINGNIGLQPQEYKTKFAKALKGLQGNVQLRGRYEHAEIPALMAAVDWVVVPSLWWENSPLVIAEAFYHQRPVICSHIGGMAEKVTHQQTGLHFRTGSAASLADTMQQVIADPSLWEQYHAQIVPPPSMERCAADYGQVYGAAL